MWSQKFNEDLFCKMFCMFVFCLFLFCPVQEVWSLSRMTHFLYYVSNAEQWNVFVFLHFSNLIFNFQKSRISLFVTVFLTWCPYSLQSSLYHFDFVLAPTFIFVILLFHLISTFSYVFVVSLVCNWFHSS